MYYTQHILRVINKENKLTPRQTKALETKTRDRSAGVCVEHELSYAIFLK